MPDHPPGQPPLPRTRADRGTPERLRELPRVDVTAETLGALVPAGLARALAREAIDAVRARLVGGEALEDVAGAVLADALERARVLAGPPLRRVLNGTGVVLHTNLGRAPLVLPTPESVGYTNLELELATGERGARTATVLPLLRRLTGAEAAAIANNAAAALMLAVAALAAGREVIVARGELVEIGGSFRLPEILEAAGVRLREVGTTNRVTASDYARAVTAESGLILKVFPSNYAIVGFTAAPSADELAGVARAAGLPLVVDLGSDPLTPIPALVGADPKPSARALLAAGADLVLFSGDKELGGPQAGLVVGRTEAVQRVARHPWMRAVRVDKLRLAALAETLRAHLLERPDAIPTHRLLRTPPDALAVRAEALAHRLAPRPIVAVPTSDAVGGGAHPLATLPGHGLAIAAPSPDALARRLRLGDPAVVPRVLGDRVVIALRAIPPEDDDDLARAIERSLDTPQSTR